MPQAQPYRRQAKRGQSRVLDAMQRGRSAYLRRPHEAGLKARKRKRTYKRGGKRQRRLRSSAVYATLARRKRLSKPK